MKKIEKYGKILLNICLTLLLIGLICYLGPKLLVFFMPFVIAFIISVIANPLVKFLEHKLKIVRKLGSAIIIVSVIALVCVGGYYLILKCTKECIEFVEKLPEMYAGVLEEFRFIQEKYSVQYNNLPQSVQDSIAGMTDSVNMYFSSMAESVGDVTVEGAGNIAKNLTNVFINIIITILAAFFFIADRVELYAFFNKVIPESVKEKSNIVMDNFKIAVGGYFKAQFKLMGIVTIILLVGFMILRIPYYGLFAVLIAILDFLPFFGTGTALIPWALFKVVAGEYKMAIGLLIIYAVSQVSRQLLQPKIVGDSMGMSPLETLFLMYIGFKVAGIGGMIIAVPVGMIFINLYKAGVFDDLIKNIKRIVDDINKFRKIE